MEVPSAIGNSPMFGIIPNGRFGGILHGYSWPGESLPFVEPSQGPQGCFWLRCNENPKKNPQNEKDNGNLYELQIWKKNGDALFRGIFLEHAEEIFLSPWSLKQQASKLGVKSPRILHRICWFLQVFVFVCVYLFHVPVFAGITAYVCIFNAYLYLCSYVKYLWPYTLSLRTYS